MHASRKLVSPLLVILLAQEIVHRLPVPVTSTFIVLFTAILLAAAVAPPAAALQERWRIPRGVTVLLVYLLGLAVLAGGVALLVPLVSSEVQRLHDRLPQYDADLRRLMERVAPGQADQVSRSALVDRLTRELGGGLGRATGAAVSLSTVVVRLVLVLVLGYFLAVEEDFAAAVVTRFAPHRHRPRVQHLLDTIGNRLGHWARAQLLLALSFGVAFGVGLRVIGEPYAVTLGVVGGILEIIPYVGGFVTVVLAVLVAATHGVGTIVAVVVWYTIVVQLEAHVVAPYLMGRALGLHPLVVVVALFVGAEALGLFGALLAVPIAVVLQALLDEFYTFGPAPPGPPATEAPAPSGGCG